jgi:hypothetical protein
VSRLALYPPFLSATRRANREAAGARCVADPKYPSFQPHAGAALIAACVHLESS